MKKTVLGLDLGANSLGWALLEKNDKGFNKIINCGTRIFEAGVAGSDDEIASGKAKSLSAARREKRLTRRQLARKRRRIKKLQHTLQRLNLLPPGDDIESIIKELDSKLLKKYLQESISIKKPDDNILPHTLPYYIRARALDMQLDNYELGRALYHLAHRRGFLSNRKNNNDSDDDSGVVKAGISELSEKIQENNARTLGEYFAFIDPRNNKIRGLWTSRKMYIDEFNEICNTQSHLISEKIKKELFDIIFYQRPLKSQRHLIGECVFEKGKKRAPWYDFAAQEFRYLQNLNNLTIKTPDGDIQDLNSKEIEILKEALNGETGVLNTKGQLTFSKAKKLLKLPAKSKFNLEEGGEKFINGNKTNFLLYQVFEERWKEFTAFEKEEIIQDLRSYVSTDGLKKRGENHWQLSPKKAEEFSKIVLEEEYCNLSLSAIDKLLPALREGKHYMEAVKEVYPEWFEAESEEHNLLPGVIPSLGDLRNPIVTRSLTELRKVVNAVIQKYGKPEQINIELARDIKNSNKIKEKIVKKNRENEKLREKARKQIIEQVGISNPTRNDILKVQLAEECNWQCPYTQKTITMSSLLGDNPQFDIEHIIPLSRSLDNSFLNKTLCYHEENRNVKKNQTPWEAYHGTEQFDAIIHSVSKFHDKFKNEKLRRFQMDNKELEDFLSDFSSRQLNDTRYATKIAMKYLGLLFGGINDSNHKQRIFGIAGGITATVRAFCGLNNILGDGVKTRDDHRHHAIDAISIALAGPNTVKSITNILKKSETYDIGKFKTREYITPPEWSSFFEDVKNSINSILASHHISKRVQGALHQETFYSKPYKEKDSKNKEIEYRHIRTELQALKEKEIKNIVDPHIQKIIKDKLDSLGESNPEKAFKNQKNLPVLYTKTGTPHSIIKKVRIKKKIATHTVGKDKRERFVISGNNHHMEIVAILDSDGNEIKWEGHVVSLLEAKKRLQNKEPLIKHNFGKDKKFKFSLACGDIITLDINGKKEICIIKSVPLSKQLSFVKINDARKQKDLKAAKNWFTATPNSLKEKNPQKYTITPLGELRRAND